MPRKSTEELVRRNLKRLVDHAVKHLELADLDKNGKVTSADLLTIVKYCAGLITEF